MIKYLKKLRKELEKWLKIPKIIIENINLKIENKKLQENNEKLYRDIDFITINAQKITDKFIKLKNEIKNIKDKAS